MSFISVFFLFFVIVGVTGKRPVMLLIRYSAENGSLVIDLPMHLHYVVVSQIRSILGNFQLI